MIREALLFHMQGRREASEKTIREAGGAPLSPHPDYILKTEGSKEQKKSSANLKYLLFQYAMIHHFNPSMLLLYDASPVSFLQLLGSFCLCDMK